MNPNVTTVVKATAADLIATTWFGLGFRPSESLVLAGLEGPRKRLGVTLRIDLPDATVSRSRQRKMIRSCLDSILASQADMVLAMLVSHAALTRPVPRIVSVVRQEAAARRLPVHDILGITSTGYRSVDCTDEQCCPREGLPIEAVMSSQAAAIHVLNGDTVADSQQGLLADVQPLPEVEGEPATGVSAAAGSSGLTPAERQRWWQVWGAAMAAVASGVGCDSASVRGLSGAMHDPDLRDTVLMDLLGGARGQLMAMLDGGSRVALQGLGSGEHHLATLLATAPDTARLATGEAVVAAAARVAPTGDRAPALAVLAMLAWYRGRGGRSRMLVQEARNDCPSLSLTGLVDDLLLSLAIPPWMRNPEI